MSNIVDVNETNFQQEVLDSDVLVVVDFWAPWCGYCTKLSPIIDEVATELAGQVKIVKMNADENRSLTQKYGIMSLPTMLVFKNGEPVERLMGFMPKANIVTKLNPLL